MEMGSSRAWLSTAAAAVMILTGSAQAAERVVLDFKDNMPGDTLPKNVLDAHLMALHEPKVGFLTADTSPPTPFPEGVHGLVVERENPDATEPRVRVRIKPFAPSGAPKVGWMEIEMVVNSPFNNGLDLGSGGASDLTSAQQPAYDGKVIVGMNLNLDKPMEVVTFPEESRKVLHRAIPSPELGVPFRLRIAWDFSGETPTVQLSINGTSLQDSSGSDLILVLPKEDVGDGIDYVSIMLRDAILGRIITSE